MKYLLLLFTFFTLRGFTHSQVNLSVTLNTTPACSKDGNVTALVTGGTPPYTYARYAPMLDCISNNTATVNESLSIEILGCSHPKSPTRTHWAA